MLEICMFLGVFHLVKSDRVWNHRLVSPYLTVPSLYLGLSLITVVLIPATILEMVKFPTLHVEKFLGIPYACWVITPLILVSIV